MRSHHLMAVGLVLVVGLASARFIAGTTVDASANAAPASGLDVSRIPVDSALPAENIDDRTFVFAPRD
jgi:hypothetical protein